MTDLMAMSVGEIAAHVRGGELRAREVVTATLERIEERDGEINAFVEVDADGALATADTIEPGDTTDHAASLMIHGGFRHLPVVEDGKVVGIVSIRDLMKVALDDRSPRGV